MARPPLKTARIFLPPMTDHILSARESFLYPPITHVTSSDTETDGEVETIVLDDRDLEDLEWARLRSQAIDV